MTDAKQELKKRTTVRIPADCSKCDNGKCKLRNKCRRWLAVPHDWQTYTHFEQPGCKYFWPMEG